MLTDINDWGIFWKHNLQILRNFNFWWCTGSNSRPTWDVAYIIIHVAQVRDAFMRHENFSIGFRIIMKTAVTQDS
jgi:hypothetical protein